MLIKCYEDTCWDLEMSIYSELDGILQYWIHSFFGTKHVAAVWQLETLPPASHYLFLGWIFCFCFFRIKKKRFQSGAKHRTHLSSLFQQTSGFLSCIISHTEKNYTHPVPTIMPMTLTRLCASVLLDYFHLSDAISNSQCGVFKVLFSFSLLERFLFQPDHQFHKAVSVHQH